MRTSTNLYEKDFYAWTKTQSNLIKTHQLAQLDLVHLQEELHLMGASEKRVLDHRLEVLLMHLLKWKYQPAIQSKSWIRTIKVQKNDLAKHLKYSPSLKAKLQQFVNDAYDNAVLMAADETNLDESIFPSCCEWTTKQILDNEFLP
jgi:hypothetical protein